MSLRTILKATILRSRGYRARMQVGTARPPRFAGAFADRTAALASLPPQSRAGYDDDAVTDVSFATMCKIAPWDYPILFWLQRLITDGYRIVDAGGHLGTKYIAFDPLLDLGRTDWTVFDLPAVISAARKKQARHDLPAQIRFQDDLAATGAADMLLASGLLQYLDMPFADLIKALPAPPKHILLNKVAMHERAALVTLEQIGPNRVPYQIRDRRAFEAELTRAGYAVHDTWLIPDLSHTIATHPWLGPSQSRGYLLVRT